jgi:hypothetical protein
VALLDPTFTISSNPAVNTAATATHAAVPGKQHILNTIHCTFNAGAVAPGAVQVSMVIRDGASGTGPVIWSSQMALTAVAGQASPPIELGGLAIQGSPGNAMTIEFTAAGGANTFETVSGTGFVPQ